MRDLPPMSTDGGEGKTRRAKREEMRLRKGENENINVPS